MNKKMTLSGEYAAMVQDAADALRAGETAASLVCIREAMMLRMDAPEPHNLLGILCEMKSDDNGARRHYRAAYALDPTYKPACRNLERLVRFEWGPANRQYDYGVEPKQVENADHQQAIPELKREGLGTA